MRCRGRINTLSLWLIFTLQFSANAQQLSFEHLSLNQGLSQSIVQVLMKDQKGFLWIGTEDGLNRYDGYGFHVFQPRPFDSTALSDGNIKALYQDSLGDLWVGTAQGGLNRFHKESMTFSSYRVNPDNPHAISSDFIWALTEDRGGNIWILAGRDAGQVNRWDRETGRFTCFGDHMDEAACLTHHRATQLMADQQGRIWIGTQQGLNQWDETTQSFIHYGTEQELGHTHILSLYEAPNQPGVLWIGAVHPTNPDDGGLYRLNMASGKITALPYGQPGSQSPAGPRITSFHEGCTGCLWVGTNRGLSRYDDETGQFTHYLPMPEWPGHPNNVILEIAQDFSRNLWLRTRGRGLYRLQAGTKTFQHFTHSASNPKSLSHNHIITLLEDPTGILWIGTDTGGLNKLDHFTEKFRTFSHNPGSPQGLRDNRIRMIFQDSAHRLWVGTANAGLTRFDADRNKTEHFARENGQHKLPGNFIGDLLEDRSGRFWLGINGHGLGRFHPETGRFTPVKHPESQSGQERKSVRRLFEDSRNRLWAGTDGAGLIRLSSDRQQLHTFKKQAGDKTSLSSNVIHDILEDRQGRIWIATSNGLNRYEEKTERFRHYTHHPSDTNSLPTKVIMSLYEGKEHGVLWLGTFGGGLVRFEIENGQSTHFDMHNSSIPSNVVYGILDDDANRLWLSTNNGLSRFDPVQEYFKNYNIDDGLQSREFNAGAYFKNANGEMYFGGINGFNVFHPDSISDNPFVPPVLITDMKIADASLPIGPNSPLKRPVCETQEVTLSHWQNDLSFEFVLLHFNQPQSNQYQYRLSPYEKRWRNADRRRMASYTHIPPGQYTFSVRAANNDGIWTPEPATLQIFIKPPWWRSKAAYIGYLLLLALGVFLFDRVMRHRIIHRERENARLSQAELRAQAAEAQSRALEAEEARMKQELDQARSLQLSMLPDSLPVIPHLDIAAHMQTATEVGGDYYDFYNDGRGGLTLALGDATGHGLNAGTVVTLVKSLFVAHAYQGDMRSLFGDITQTLRHMHFKKLFMGLLLGRLTDHELTLTSAGMPPVYLWRQAEEQLMPIVTKSLPLGAMENFPYTEHRIHLNIGDTLLFMTDGLPELFNDRWEEFDFDRIEQVFRKNASRSAQAVIEALTTAADQWRDERPLSDDMTLVVVKVINGHDEIETGP